MVWFPLFSLAWALHENFHLIFGLFVVQYFRAQDRLHSYGDLVALYLFFILSNVDFVVHFAAANSMPSRTLSIACPNR